MSGTVVSFFETTANTQVGTAYVGDGPYSIDLSPTGDLLYVGNSSSSSLSIVSTATTLTVNTIALTGGVYGVAAHPGGTKLYVVNPDLDRLAVLETSGFSVIKTIPVGDQPALVAINPAGTRAYVSNRGDDTVSVVDLASDAVVDTIAVGDVPLGIAVSPDGNQVYVGNEGDGTVTVIDAASHLLTAFVYVGGTPYGISAHPDGSRVYVANPGGDYVSVIDLTAYTVLEQIPVCGSPIAFGKFITDLDTTAAPAVAATGVLELDLDFGNGALLGTLDFDPGPVSIFGTPVDIDAQLGGVPMDVSMHVVDGLPGGVAVSFNASSASVPGFSLSGTGSAQVSGAGVDLDVPLVASGVVLPTGPSYTLLAKLGWTEPGLPGFVIGLAGPFTLTATLPANTPEGADVHVPVAATLALCPSSTSAFAIPVDIAFANVSSAGSTLVSGACQTPASIPPNIRVDVGGLVFFFDVSTSAAYDPPITICATYPDNDQDGFIDGTSVDESSLVLLHDEGGGNFQPAANGSVDPVLNRLCGEVSHLSPFLIAAAGAPAAFVAPDQDARKCEDKLSKLGTNLVKALVKCARKSAQAAAKQRPFDAQNCTAVAQGKYDEKAARLGPCPSCIASSVDSLRDAAVGLVRGVTSGLYCDGTVPLPADFGFVPPSDAAARCAKLQGRNLAKLGKRLGICYRKLADAGFKAQAFDVTACVGSADADFDAANAAIDGCETCAVSNAPGLRNQIDRFAVDSLDELYCAGSTPLSLP